MTLDQDDSLGAFTDATRDSAPKNPSREKHLSSRVCLENVRLQILPRSRYSVLYIAKTEQESVEMQIRLIAKIWSSRRPLSCRN